MNKIMSYFTAILVVLFITQTILCEEDTGSFRKDVLYILNPDTVPRILTDLDSPLARAGRDNRVCRKSSCQRICHALNFKDGYCRPDKLCACT